MVEKKLKKKKKKRPKEEESRQCSNGPDDETEGAEPPSKKCATDDAKSSKKAAGTMAGSCTHASIRNCSEKLGYYSLREQDKNDLWIFFPPAPATVVVWDSQVKDGYKRSKAPAADDKSDDSSKCAASLSWDGKKTSGVVEELLKNASDKAYGANGKTFFFVFSFSAKITISDFFFCPLQSSVGTETFLQLVKMLLKTSVRPNLML